LGETERGVPGPGERGGAWWGRIDGGERGWQPQLGVAGGATLNPSSGGAREVSASGNEYRRAGYYFSVGAGWEIPLRARLICSTVLLPYQIIEQLRILKQILTFNFSKTYKIYYIKIIILDSY
jgi:hypothetical protein